MSAAAPAAVEANPAATAGGGGGAGTTQTRSEKHVIAAAQRTFVQLKAKTSRQSAVGSRQSRAACLPSFFF